MLLADRIKGGAKKIAIQPCGAESGDPLWEHVVLLLHGNGVHGSTSLVDYSPEEHMITAGNGVYISEDRSKTCGSSLYNPHTLDAQWQITEPDVSNKFNLTGVDATLEFYVNLYKTADANCKLFSLQDDTNTNGWNDDDGLYYFVLIGTDSVLTLYYKSGAWTSRPIALGALSLDTWHHVAIVTELGGAIRLYLDGALTTSANGVSQKPGTRNAFSIAGDRIGAPYLSANAYLDEIRFTKAVRYTSAFTPGPLPYPNGGV